MSADTPRGMDPGSPDATADPQSSRWYDAEAGPVVRFSVRPSAYRLVRC